MKLTLAKKSRVESENKNNGFNNCKCSFYRAEKWQKCHKACMDRWNVLCLGLYMHTWCAVIITLLDHFLILTIHGTLLILYLQQDYRYSDKYKGHYCYKLFCSWQMCLLKNYSWQALTSELYPACPIDKNAPWRLYVCFHVFIPFEDNLAFNDTIRFGDDCATGLPWSPARSVFFWSCFRISLNSCTFKFMEWQDRARTNIDCEQSHRMINYYNYVNCVL